MRVGTPYIAQVVSLFLSVCLNINCEKYPNVHAGEKQQLWEKRAHIHVYESKKNFERQQVLRGYFEAG